MIIWIYVEVIILPGYSWLHTVYFVAGVVQLILVLVVLGVVPQRSVGGAGLSGEVEAYAPGFHRYIPAAGLEPQSAPPSFQGQGEVREPGAEEPSYWLHFGTGDRHATTFAGTFRHVDEPGGYLVELRRR